VFFFAFFLFLGFLVWILFASVIEWILFESFHFALDYKVDAISGVAFTVEKSSFVEVQVFEVVLAKFFQSGVVKHFEHIEIGTLICPLAKLIFIALAKYVKIVSTGEFCQGQVSLCIVSLMPLFV
jgi:hypothetical protein